MNKDFLNQLINNYKYIKYITLPNIILVLFFDILKIPIYYYYYYYYYFLIDILLHNKNFKINFIKKKKKKKKLKK